MGTLTHQTLIRWRFTTALLTQEDTVSLRDTGRNCLHKIAGSTHVHTYFQLRKSEKEIEGLTGISKASLSLTDERERASVYD